MKKKKYGLLIIVILLALLVVAFFALRRYNEVSEERTSVDESVSLFDIDESLVSGFTVENESGTFTFVRNGEDWIGEDDAADIEKLNVTKIDDLLSSVCLLTSDYVLTNPLELSEYGLDEPVARVTLRTSGGGEAVLSFGDDNDSIDRQYAGISGDDNVYCISQYTGGLYDFTADEITSTDEDEEGESADEKT